MLTYNNKVLKIGSSNVWLKMPDVDPYNPLNLPSHTIRCKFSSGYTPTQGNSRTLVDADENVWDIYKGGNNWSYLFSDCTLLLAVLGANTTGVSNCSGLFFECMNLGSVALFDTTSATTMDYMFNGCATLTSVPLYDMSSVTDAHNMFMYCSLLTSIPLFDTSSVTNMSSMFYGCNSVTSIPLLSTASAYNTNQMFMACRYVQTGALALYNQASSQRPPITQHNQMFTSCGSKTTTGAEELALIPADWGGLGG